MTQSHDTSPISRRQALMAGAALPLAAASGGALGALGGPAAAQPAMLGVSRPPYNRVRLGGFEVTTLLAGTRTVPDPQTIFGLNVSPEDFAAVSAENLIPDDRAQFFFTPTLVNTGSELILFDTGLNAAGITDALAAAGYGADQVDTVVITHMHGDHIGGLLSDGAPTFANARYVTGAVEFDAFAGMENDGFEANVRPLAERFAMLDDGGAVAPGVTAMLAAGHTPGHMAYLLDSEGAQLLIAADFANHFVWSLAHPDWEVRFDRDKAAAAATRRRLLDMLAAERMPFIGYHMPFPGLGYVAPEGEGYRYLPASYQLIMD